MGNSTGVEIQKYFRHKQRVFLIDVSENRDRGMYESLSGTIVGRGKESVFLRLPYSTGTAEPKNDTRRQTFKLTTVTMGNGIQVMADLLAVEAGTTLHLKLRSNLEMYQRCRPPRMDTTIKLFQMQCNSSLDTCRSELRRMEKFIKRHGVPRNIAMNETGVNIGVGGIRVELGAGINQSPLSLFVLDLDDNGIPISALAEQVWSRHANGMKTCGYRFIQISKTDQQRISAYIQDLQEKRKIVVPRPKTTWELLDRMMCDAACM